MKNSNEVMDYFSFDRAESAVRRQLARGTERTRLVRLCAQLTGDPDSAEDLAQEALVEAWRHAHCLRDEAAWRPWLGGIARNVCLRWQRRYAREAARAAPTPLALEDIAAPFLDAEAGLEQGEIAVLLDRAMGRLPSAMRQLLVERYVDDLSPSEIAARRGVSENVASVRLHRGKASLRRVLTTEMKHEAAALGLLDEDTVAGWQETRLWCPRCGQHRLLGCLNRTAGSQLFDVRCASCGPALGRDFSSRHHALPFDEVLGGVSSFRPALRRVHAWWGECYRRALATGSVPCHRCGRPAPATSFAPAGTPAAFARIGGLYSVCSCSRDLLCFSPAGLALMLPEAQRFWQRHPRLRLLPQHDIRFGGVRDAVVTRLESVSERASLEVVAARDTFAVLAIREEAG